MDDKGRKKDNKDENSICNKDEKGRKGQKRKIWTKKDKRTTEDDRMRECDKWENGGKCDKWENESDKWENERKGDKWKNERESDK